MLQNERQEEILKYLKQNRSATVRALADELFVSDATVRRDLAEMQNLGLLKRSHGGAVLLESADETSIFVRMGENAREKERAASVALRYIPDDFETVFLDSSSTVLALARRMNLSDKTVVTNGIQTAAELAKVRGIRLILIGGNVSPTGTSVRGSWTNTLLSEFRFDLMLVSCASFREQSTFETSLDQREIKRTVFGHSKKRILVADHTKYARSASYALYPIEAFDHAVFDDLPAEVRELLQLSTVHIN